MNPARPGGVREQTTRERWQQVHNVLDKGVGLLECSRPESLRDKDAALLRELTKDCFQTAELARLPGKFAELLAPAEGNDSKLTDWITAVRAADLPYLHSFTNGLELDRAAVDAGLATLYHNGRTEGVNTRTKKMEQDSLAEPGSPCSASESCSTDHPTALPPIT